jgi:hypothetical protein
MFFINVPCRQRKPGDPKRVNPYLMINLFTKKFIHILSKSAIQSIKFQIGQHTKNILPAMFSDAEKTRMAHNHFA